MSYAIYDQLECYIESPLTPFGTTAVLGNIIRASGTQTHLKIGRGSCVFSGMDLDALGAIEEGMIAKVKYTELRAVGDGPWNGLFTLAYFRIENIHKTMTSRGWGLEISGPDILTELSFRMVDNGPIDDGAGGPATADDIVQITANKPGGWSLVALGNTADGTYHSVQDEDIYTMLVAAANQSGEYFRRYNVFWTGGRELEWYRTPGASIVELIMPSNPMSADADPSKGIILEMVEDEQLNEEATRIRVYGAGMGEDRLTIAEAETYVTVPTGYSVVWASSTIIDDDAEAIAPVIEKVKTFPGVKPADNTLTAATNAAIALYKTAIQYLTNRRSSKKFYRLVCDIKRPLQVGDLVTINCSFATGAGTILNINDDFIIQEITLDLGEDGLVRHRLLVGEGTNPTRSPADQHATIVGAIKELRTANRYTTAAYGLPGTSSTDHGALSGLSDDDHVAYLLSNGGRQLTGNLAVTNGITIDGVDISVHATTANAHHTWPLVAGNGIAITGDVNIAVSLSSPSALEFSSGLRVASSIAGNGLAFASQVLSVNVGNGTEISGDAVVVKLASVPGLSFSGTGLQIDDTIAGNGLTISSKVLAINLGSPSGLEIATDALQVADTIAGDGLTITGKVLAVGVGAGLSVAADSVYLTTPGTLTVTSANTAAGSHTHAITASANPGAATALLKSDSSGYLQLVRLGLQVAPLYPLHVAGATEQFRLEYNTANYTSFVADSTGTLTITPTNNLNLYAAGNVVFDPTGNDILPATSYDLNIGQLFKKYLTLHAAELWVETLVAQDTIATIGGRILVGPTTTLTRDLKPTAATFVNTRNTANASSSTLIADAPVGSTTNHLLLIVIQTTGLNYQVTISSAGWTQIGSYVSTSGYQSALFYGIHNGDSSYTFAFNKVTASACTMVAYSGVNTSNPIGSTNVSAVVSSLNVTAPALTLVDYDQRVCLLFGAQTDTSWSLPAGVNERLEPGADKYAVADITTTTISTTAYTAVQTTLQNSVAYQVAINGSVSSNIYVKHNQMASGDRVLMEARLKVEFMAITSSATLQAEGDYLYTVTRDLDGTGANSWYAGDAMFNTGQTGNGFIDLYSVRGANPAGSTAGPTIVGNVRNSSTYNDWSEHWAIGNLKGIYGYGTNTYGVGLGKYSTGTSYLLADATNGIRIMRGTTQLGQWDISGNILVGQAAASQSNIYITSGTIQLRNNTTVLGQWDASGGITVGEVGASKSNILISAGALSIRSNTTVYTTLDSSGNLTIGRVAASQSNIYITSGAIQLRNNTTVLGTWDASGGIVVGEVAANKSNVSISSGEIALKNNTTPKIRIQSDGDLLIGTDANSASTTTFVVFTNAQTYNGESIGAGDLLIGSNSAGKANILWDSSAAQLLFRGGTSAKAYIDTDGAIKAGGGVVLLDDDGLSIRTASSYSVANSILFTDSTKTYEYSIFYTIADSGGNYTYITSNASVGQGANRSADINLHATGNGTGDGSIELGAGASFYRFFETFASFPVDLRLAKGLTIGSISIDPPDNAILFVETSSTPASPASGTEANVYVKANKIIFQWNDAGTIRYKYLDLTGTGVTWVHTTSAP